MSEVGGSSRLALKQKQVELEIDIQSKYLEKVNSEIRLRVKDLEGRKEQFGNILQRMKSEGNLSPQPHVNFLRVADLKANAVSRQQSIEQVKGSIANLESVKMGHFGKLQNAKHTLNKLSEVIKGEKKKKEAIREESETESNVEIALNKQFLDNKVGNDFFKNIDNHGSLNGEDRPVVINTDSKISLNKDQSLENFSGGELLASSQIEAQNPVNFTAGNNPPQSQNRFNMGELISNTDTHQKVGDGAPMASLDCFTDSIKDVATWRGLGSSGVDLSYVTDGGAKLSLSLTSGEGGVRVSIGAEDARSRHNLRQGKQEIEEALRSKGLKIREFKVIGG